MTARTDLVGKRFERWLVIEYIKSYDGKTRYKCICTCGKEKVVLADSLKSRKSKSCGCLISEILIKRNISTIKHGMSYSNIYQRWANMFTRCYNKNSLDYKNWGGRGIIVCERWKKFENFYKDMGDPPQGMTLDRIDNNGIYEPSNCRWTTYDIQRQNSRMYTYKGSN